MAIAAVIPALNEAETIGGLVKSLLGRVDLVIVIDDGSTDDTGGLALEAGAHTVIYHDKPQNIAASIVEGMKFAMQRGDVRRIVTIDAGGSHFVGDLPGLLQVDADIVIGSRFCKLAAYVGNPVRERMSRLAALMCGIAKHRPKINDWTSGYRVYNRKAAGELIYQDYSAAGHAFQIETLTKAIRRGLTIKEAPITYLAGRSSLSVKSIDEAFSAWLELLFS